ncbi:hypothetical protein [Edaphocola flava]|uniref:hypothetical protein n=1 Tax=Edaphocola flava TaxID=2499629 RepID=UPI001386F7E0|nr:hypothetical protein [Edaphocola flava]
MQFVNTLNPQDIDAGILCLAEHHLYGHSRLGGQYYNWICIVQNEEVDEILASAFKTDN